MWSIVGIIVGFVMYGAGNVMGQGRKIVSGPKVVTLPLNTKQLQAYGVPEDTEMMNVVGSKFVLEFKQLSDGHYQVYLCDEQRDVKCVAIQHATEEQRLSLTEKAKKGELRF